MTSLGVFDVAALLFPRPSAVVEANWSTVAVMVVVASTMLVVPPCTIRLVVGLYLLFKVVMGFPLTTLKLLLNSISVRSSTGILHCFA